MVTKGYAALSAESHLARFNSNAARRTADVQIAIGSAVSAIRIFTSLATNGGRRPSRASRP